jgi:FtsH-binding integral membrane protein
MSFLVAAICGSVYNFYKENGASLVVIAALLTLTVTLALTIYAFTTKTDFTMMGILLI